MNKKTTALVVCMALGVRGLIGWAVAQDQLQNVDGLPKFRMTTEIAPGIASPGKVETRFGALKLFDGVPDQASTE